MIGGRRLDSDWIQVYVDQEYVIEVIFKRFNKFKVSVWYNICILQFKKEIYVLIIGFEFY